MITENQIKKAKLRFLIGNHDDCVGRVLSKKRSQGIAIDDQAIAIALSECGQSRASKKIKIGIAKLKLKQLRVAAEGDPSTSQSEGSPDGPHFTLKKIKRKGFPEGRGTMEKVGKIPWGIMRLASDESKFAKYYLLDGLETNGNGWGVTDSSIPTNIQTFIGQPFVITARDWIPNSPYEDQFDHPFVPTNELKQIFAHQERFRVGDIVKVAKDDDGRWYAMIKKAKRFENMNFPPFCSPAIYQTNPHEPDNGITEWFGLHLAGLMDEPAYGPRVALLKGSCSGTMGQCTHQFRMAKQKNAIGLESSEIKPIQPIGSSGIKDSEFSDSPFGGDKKKDDDCECPKLKDMKARMRKINKGKLGKRVPLIAQVKKLKKKTQYAKDFVSPTPTTTEPKKVSLSPDAIRITKALKDKGKDNKDDDKVNVANINKLDGLLKERQALLEDKQKIEARELSKKVKTSMLDTLNAINGDENGERT